MLHASAACLRPRVGVGADEVASNRHLGGESSGPGLNFGIVAGAGVTTNERLNISHEAIGACMAVRTHLEYVQ